jgi:hypothetical protein
MIYRPIDPQAKRKLRATVVNGTIASATWSADPPVITLGVPENSPTTSTVLVSGVPNKQKVTVTCHFEFTDGQADDVSITLKGVQQ